MEEAKKFIDEQVLQASEFFNDFKHLIPEHSRCELRNSHLVMYALFKAAKIKYIDPFKYVVSIYSFEDREEAWIFWKEKIVEVAVINNDINIVKYTLENYDSAHNKQRDLADIMGYSIQHDRLDIIKYIVSMGFNANKKITIFNMWHYTIELAFIKERHDIVKYLASLGTLDELNTSIKKLIKDRLMKEVIKNRLLLDSLINQKEKALNTNLNYLNKLVGEFL